MARKTLGQEERARLVEQLSHLTSEADAEQSGIERVFLPLSRHALALRPETLVIRGERGAGKTALFHFLRAMEPETLRRVVPGANLPDASWVEGFAETSGHPMNTVLDVFADQADDAALRVFWAAHLACRLQSEGVSSRTLPAPLYKAWESAKNSPAEWVRVAQQELGAVTQWLDDVDAQLAREERTVFVSYDYLDRLGYTKRAVRARFAGALLALWLSLANRYSRIRPKVFIREDLFEDSQEAFPDASKLASRSVSLDWEVESLYRLLVRRIAALSDELRDWLGIGANAVDLTEDPTLGYLPPAFFPESRQKAFVDHLVGEQMGKGVKKGYTYRWIPNRLQDARVRIVPRSLLNLVGYAARHASAQLQARGQRLLTPDNLVEALYQTSSDRVKELKEEHKVVSRLEHLRATTVMLEAREVEQRLRQPGAEDDGLGDDGAAVARELLRLGVLKLRTDGRIDVPDIYRYGFGIKRKGGVAHPR
jgi:hypothetical protein